MDCKENKNEKPSTWWNDSCYVPDLGLEDKLDFLAQSTSNDEFLNPDLPIKYKRLFRAYLKQDIIRKAWVGFYKAALGPT